MGKVRPSPSMSATKCFIGARAKGGDGNTWEVNVTDNGVRRWMKVASKKAAVMKVAMKAAMKVPVKKAMKDGKPG